MIAVGADLDQADLVKVRMHRVRLGVESDSLRVGAALRRLAHTQGRIDPKRGQGFGHGWGW